MIGRSLTPLKVLLPPPARRRLGAWHRERVLRRALGAFGRDPGALAGGGSLAGDLVYGWANDTWSASEEYLIACVKHALRSPGPILECGSGLTTLLLGMVARRTGATVWTLEHDPAWFERVRHRLGICGLNATGLRSCPLRAFDGFSWYDAPLQEMPREFPLVICDGPPYTTPGGRYGLLPAMRERLAPAAVILLDDAGRPGERIVIERWEAEFGARCDVLGGGKPYARITCRGGEAGP